MDVYHQIKNDTKAEDGKILAVLGEKDFFLNKSLLQECIDHKIALILININSEDKKDLCPLVFDCSKNTDDYFYIWLPSNKDNYEFSFSLYKNKKTEAPTIASSSSETSKKIINNANIDNTYILKAENPFEELAKIIEKESLFGEYKVEKDQDRKRKISEWINGEKLEKIQKETVKMVSITNDRTGTIFGSKSLAADEEKLTEYIEKNIPIFLLDVDEKEKQFFCKKIESCANGPSYFVAFVPFKDENGNLESVNVYDYLKDGTKFTVTLYNF
ncbi:expressed protein [Dictyostelium purpureum]|uniref:Expressed protein n=1 Tax=Dictyostelium purpureum TaxID=5786 RepID=F0ZSE7_DICPU|nr:uncharacterized protein DICPUDRAFT_95120 [Dictyostelium purpureum]EGC33147.1 expressed protein [Dictyostelium purpureum]|eukprot:XP_003290342.1 expressed protein [Dictyostelium purpureum]